MRLAPSSATVTSTPSTSRARPLVTVERIGSSAMTSPLLSRRAVLIGGATVALAAACGGGGDDESADTTTTTTTPTEPELVLAAGFRHRRPDARRDRGPDSSSGSCSPWPTSPRVS